MAKAGRPKTIWKKIPVSPPGTPTMSAPEAAKYLGVKLNTLHKQMIRDRANCVSDGHISKNERGHWVIRPSVKEVFQQEQ